VRIARQLTDGRHRCCHLILRAEMCQRVAEHAPETLDAELVGLRTLAAKSLLDIRARSSRCAPWYWTNWASVPTLRRYANDFARENGATIRSTARIATTRSPAYTGGALPVDTARCLALVYPGIGTRCRSMSRRKRPARCPPRRESMTARPKTIVERFLEKPTLRKRLS